MKKILMLLCLALAASSCNDFTTSPDTETETRLVALYTTTGNFLWSSTSENEYTYYLTFVIYGLEPTEPLKFTLRQTNFPAVGVPEAVRLQTGEADITYKNLTETVFEFGPGETSVQVPIVLLRDNNRLNNTNSQIGMTLAFYGWKTVFTFVPLTDDLRLIGSGSFTLTEKKQ